jgi:hypothetical protein
MKSNEFRVNGKQDRVRLDVLTAINMKNFASWGVMPCSLMGTCTLKIEAACSSEMLANFLLDYMTSQTTALSLSLSLSLSGSPGQIKGKIVFIRTLLCGVNTCISHQDFKLLYYTPFKCYGNHTRHTDCIISHRLISVLTRADEFVHIA